MPTLARFVPKGEGSGAAAARGTRIHELAHNWMEQGKDPPETFWSEAADRVDETTVAMQYRNAVVNKFGAGNFVFEEEIESRNYPDYVGGSIDGYAVVEDVLWLWDLKTGKGLVDPVNNMQLLFYMYLLLGKIGCVYTTFMLGVWQAGEFKWWAVDYPKLHDLMVKMEDSILECKNAPRLSRGPHCLWCKAKKWCVENERHMTIKKETVTKTVETHTKLTEW
jgi:hypothetical protein